MNPQHPEHHHHIIHDGRIARLIEDALMEDLGVGDVTTDAIVSPELSGRGDIIAKGAGIVSGLEVAGVVFSLVDTGLEYETFVPDGSEVDSLTVIGRISGPLSGILKGERTALNILQRMSGISTLTRKFVHAVDGTRAVILDTRKTPPGLRVLDKFAVRLGGGANHRFGLDDMVLIKDNHIAAAGSITLAVQRVNAYLAEHQLHLPVEVETDNLAEVSEALACPGVTRIMLDNLSLDETRSAVALIRGKSGSKIEIEASGNVTLQTVRGIAETGVDFISVGALTHSVPALDISLDITSG